MQHKELMANHSWFDSLRNKGAEIQEAKKTHQICWWLHSFVLSMISFEILVFCEGDMKKIQQRDDCEK